MTPKPDEVALYEAKAGFVRPEATVAAHLSWPRGHGADLHFDEPMVSWRPHRAAASRCRTAAGTYTAGQLVISPGPWAPQLLADLGVPFTIERQVQYWFQPIGGVEPFLPGPAPDLHLGGRGRQPDLRLPGDRRPGRRRQGRVLPRAARRPPRRPSTREVHDDEIAAMAAAAGARLPDPARHVPARPNLHVQHHARRALRDRPASRRHEAVTVACGFSGHGFKFVPVVGEILADLATTGHHPASDRAVRSAPPVRGDDMTTPSLIPTLPGRYYTDPAIFALEQERIFETMWFCVVRGADVGTPGDFRTVPGGPRERPGDPVRGRQLRRPSSTSAGIAVRCCARRRPAR